MGDIITKIPYQRASRSRSWITIEQIESEHWEVVKKICDVIFTPGKYVSAAENFARNILDFLNDHQFITWKQYDAVMNIKSIAEMKDLNYYYKKAEKSTRLNDGDIGPIEKVMLRKLRDGMDEKYLGSGLVSFDVDITGEVIAPDY